MCGVKQFPSLNIKDACHREAAQDIQGAGQPRNWKTYPGGKAKAIFNYKISRLLLLLWVKTMQNFPFGGIAPVQVRACGKYMQEMH